MKFTVLGFNQKKAIDLGFDVNDLLIIRWFIDFYHSGKMVKMNVNDKEYVWVNYAKIIEDIPIIGMKKDTIFRRLKKICEAGIMEHETMKQGGTFSLYRLTKEYEQLLCSSERADEEDGIRMDIRKGTDINPEGYGYKSVGGTDKNPEQNINQLKDTSIKDSSIKDIYMPVSGNPLTENPETVKDAFVDYSRGDPELLDTLKEFEKMRKAIKKPMSGRAKTLLLKELDKLAIDRQTKIDILNQSILNSWQGVFPLKAQQRTGNNQYSSSNHQQSHSNRAF